MPTLGEISNTLEKIKERWEKAIKARARTSAYTGPSIVDYLKSTGQPSDYASRAKLATQHGITNYTGIAAQNTQLLNTLRKTTPPPPKPPKKETQRKKDLIKVLAEVQKRGIKLPQETKESIAKAVGISVPAVAAPVTPTAPAPTSPYTGASIVDYLKSTGQPSSFTSRAKLAAQYGITDYRGTAQQNIQLLNLLKAGASTAVTPPVTPEGETVTPEGETTEEITPTTPTELYDIGKIQTDLTTASASKKAAYNELIGLQSKQYDTEYNKLGLGDLKTQVAGVDSDIADEKRVRDESIDKVRRNPYYSAATITGEVAEIERTSNARLNRLIDQRNSIAGQFNAGIDDIARKVGYATSDAQTKHSYWENEEKRLSGLVSTYQTELRRQLERAEAAPAVIGTAETGYRQWDPATKTWKMIIPPTPPTPKERVEKFQSIKDPITGKSIGYFNPATGESHYYSPEELGVPGAPGVSEVGTYTDDQMREYIRDKIRRWGVGKGDESKIQDAIDKDTTISADQKERMKAILLEEMEIARGMGFWGRFVSPEW